MTTLPQTTGEAIGTLIGGMFVQFYKGFFWALGALIAYKWMFQ